MTLNAATETLQVGPRLLCELSSLQCHENGVRPKAQADQSF